MDMSRIRIEGLLAAFPKLVGTGKQHTFVEVSYPSSWGFHARAMPRNCALRGVLSLLTQTENVRYIYQPMEVRLLFGLCMHASGR